MGAGKNSLSYVRPGQGPKPVIIEWELLPAPFVMLVHPAQYM